MKFILKQFYQTEKPNANVIYMSENMDKFLQHFFGKMDLLPYCGSHAIAISLNRNKTRFWLNYFCFKKGGKKAF